MLAKLHSDGLRDHRAIDLLDECGIGIQIGCKRSYVRHDLHVDDEQSRRMLGRGGFLAQSMARGQIDWISARCCASVNRSQTMPLMSMFDENASAAESSQPR